MKTVLLDVISCISDYFYQNGNRSYNYYLMTMYIIHNNNFIVDYDKNELTYMYNLLADEEELLALIKNYNLDKRRKKED